MSKGALIFGAGQLGSALQAAAAARQRPTVLVPQEELDLTRPEDVAAVLDRHRPAMAFNAAAYTAVDKAEEEPEAAFVVNARAVADLARLCRGRGILLVHVSTDYVFDGSAVQPYREDDPPCPISAYGRSKAAGDQALIESGADFLCLRTAWMFGQGNNFIRTILRLAREQPRLRVVHDQTGSPTYARDLAEAAFRLVDARARGFVNATNWGFATRHELAVHALSCARLETPVDPCTTEEFPRPAHRPANSRLDLGKLVALTGWRPPHWREAVRDYVATLDRRNTVP